MKRILAAIALSAFLLSGCGGTDPREGVMRRYIIESETASNIPEKYYDVCISMVEYALEDFKQYTDEEPLFKWFYNDGAIPSVVLRLVYGDHIEDYVFASY